MGVSSSGHRRENHGGFSADGDSLPSPTNRGWLRGPSMSTLGWAFLHFTGADNGSGPWYLFWSGFGSDITEFAIVGGILSLYLRHNCHVKGCWRIGRHPIQDTPYIVCGRHHPTGAPTHADIQGMR
jgi:hypothetical protein